MSMDVFEAIQSRRSIRKFEKREVPDELVTKLLQAAIVAPSAGNLQARHFYVVTDAATKRKLREAALDQDFVETAPVDIVVCVDYDHIKHYGKRGAELYCIQDASASVQNILLAATALGLGTCWIGAFEESQVTEIMRLPAHRRPVAIIPVGYPAEKPKRRPRVKFDDAVG